MREAWHRLMPDDGDRKRAESGEHAFQYDDLVGVLRRDVARAVVLEAPADRRRNDKQRTIREPEAVRSLEREQDARKRDERNRDPESLRDRLLENEKRNNRRGHDLEVAKQGRVGGCAVPNTKHEKDGRGDVEDDHADDERHVSARQRRGCLAVMGVQKRENRNADSRAKIEKCGHGGRPDIPQQYL